ncbi:ATP-binding domain-containing protein [Streptomyces cinnamoneus]|uniref:ATP-binding domain-containing protein n=1 Tax=Streptomyces cinnamoneus TaxID=53446 RepID=UPI0027E54733|nr:ATP-binding domain-containing protein [Streptomyces cinnamoneus]
MAVGTDRHPVEGALAGEGGGRLMGGGVPQTHADPSRTDRQSRSHPVPKPMVVPWPRSSTRWTTASTSPWPAAETRCESWLWPPATLSQGKEPVIRSCSYSSPGANFRTTLRTTQQAQTAYLGRPRRRPRHRSSPGAVDRLGAENACDVTVSTVHKAKGREWPSVRIGEDFAEPEPDALGRPGPIPVGEARLAYVAITRARHHLDVGGLGWFKSHPQAVQAQTKLIAESD